MRGLASLAALLALALAAALPAGASSGAAGARADAAPAAKKCKRGRALHRGRCVRHCPKGYVKKRVNRRLRCVRRAGATPPPAAPQPLFEKPSGELTGEAAFNHFSRYFFNARFTNCPGGWPSCAVEERYDHCASGGETGSWVYHRYTPSSGSDINSYGQYQVSGAAAHPDGSWGVEYHELLNGSSSPSFYSWSVAADGTVTGLYWPPGALPPNPPDQQLGPLRWQQPASCE